ncbi:MAG: hypothetical protein JW909_09910 [Planctomycetes bacterium]|nr:hypothetical protein [Planctomycetota bacterium]
MRVLGAYVLANTPLALAVAVSLNEVTAGHRSGLAFSCLLLTVSTLWRWAILAVMQRRIQEDITGSPPAPLRRHLGRIIIVKLAANTAMTWGSLAIIPAFYGFFLSGFAVPLLLESNRNTYSLIKQSIAWLNNSRGRLAKLSGALMLQFFAAVIAILVLQLFFTSHVVGSLMGLDPTELALTVWSPLWLMSMGFFLFMAFDFYWTVSAVMLFYDLQARRLGTDLRARMQALSEETNETA